VRGSKRDLRRIFLVVVALAAGAALLIAATDRVPARRAQAPPTPVAGEWVGRSAPEFALSMLDDRRVRLSDFRGKVVIVNFWATWCASCKVEIPWLVEFYKRYHAQGLEILGVSVDDGERERVAKFVHERGVNYTILLKDESAGEAYGGLRFLPQSFFVGRNGRILERTYGIRSKEDFEADVRGALGLPRNEP